MILNRAFNVAVITISNRIFPLGFDVSPDAPNSFESMIAHYEKTGRVMVWDGASDQTIFGCPEVNYHFRAWHDSKHIIFRFGFSRQGEESVLGKQWQDIRALYDGTAALFFCRIVTAEIRGQFDYNAIRGGFPLDQIGFVKAYLENPESALSGDFGISPSSTEIGV